LNGTCSDTCEHPFAESYDGDVKMCLFACDDMFLNLQGTCQTTCDSPFIERIQGLEKYCDTPCGTNGYLYENNTCHQACEYPFVEDNSKGYLECKFKCTDVDEFLLEDGNCTGCYMPYAQVTTGVERYCEKPCKDSEFLYENDTCHEDCDFPFVESTVGGVKYCKFMCNKFLAWDNQCQQNCDAPFIKEIKGVERYCKSPCALPDYLYENVTCMETCGDNFIEYDVRHIKYCNFSCTDFLAWDGNCLGSCDSPLIDTVQGVERYCQVPCGEDEFYYKNGTCSVSCETPFVQRNNGNFDTCEVPCSSGSDFLDWTGECVANCPISFQQTTQDLIKTCLFHCSDDNHYHYWNETCLETCDAPLITTSDHYDHDYKYCGQPCPEDEYLYQNGSCSAECHYQIIADPANQVKNCSFPCNSNEYYYQNETCKDSCPSPYKKSSSSDGFLLCNSPCDSDEYYRQELAACVSHCSYPLSSRTEGVLKICENVPTSGNNGTNTTTEDNSNNSTSALTSLAEQLEKLAESISSFASAASEACSFVRPNDPNSGFMISSAKGTKHVKLLSLSVYTETSESRRVLEEADSESSSGFSLTGMFTYKMPKSLKNQYGSGSVPEAFRGKVAHSSFLVNFWESMTSFISLLVLGIFFIVCDFIAKKTNRPTFIAVMGKLRTLTEWNFLLFVFFNCYDDITLYTIIELKTLQLNTFPAVVSFLICLSVCFIGVYMIYKVIKITKDSLKLKRQVFDMNAAKGVDYEDDFCKKYSKYQVVHVGYQNNSFAKQGFLFFYLCKVILSYIIIGCLYNFATIQTGLLTAISFVMLCYLFKERPTYDKFHLIIIISFEVFGFITNLCMLILAILTSEGSSHIAQQEILIKVILIVGLINDCLTSLVLWIYVLMAVYTAFKKTREPGVEAKTAWLNVIVAPFQPPGMEFYEEEDTMDSESGDPEKGLKPRRRRRIRPSRRKTNTRKILPANLLAKNRDETSNVATPDETITICRKYTNEKLTSMPTLQGFLRVQLQSDPDGGVSIESENEGLDQNFTPMMSPVSSDRSTTIQSSVMSPLSSPGKDQFRQRKSRFSPVKSSTHRQMASLDKYVPDVIIEETSPGNKKPEDPETPLNHRRTRTQTLKIEFKEIQRENKLLRARGLKSNHRPSVEQSAEEVVNLERVRSNDTNAAEKGALTYRNEIEDDAASIKTFSKMVRNWKQRTTFDEERGILGSTMTSIVVPSDRVSNGNSDEKGSRGSSRGLTVSRNRSFTRNYSDVKSRDSVITGGGGAYTLRESRVLNHDDDDDNMLIMNLEDGRGENHRRNYASGSRTFRSRGFN